MFGDADDSCPLEGPAEAQESLWWPAAWAVTLLAFLAFLAACGAAWAQVGAPSQCGPTSVGSSAAVNVTYPASGTHGPSSPSKYVSISSPGASNYLCVNPVGGTAAVSGSGCAAGSFYIGPLAPPLTWPQPGYAPPATISVIASASSTPVTCAYQ